MKSRVFFIVTLVVCFGILLVLSKNQSVYIGENEGFEIYYKSDRSNFKVDISITLEPKNKSKDKPNHISYSIYVQDEIMSKGYLKLNEHREYSYHYKSCIGCKHFTSDNLILILFYKGNPQKITLKKQ
ncbi:hypothetical protein DXT76_15325 [Halobacillus trueperi]|uniref:Uncharacterized protein n=1 Tax=Halobacillus trueperi TaxID=156205 RepID=A0A3D8VL60_9BACI|nr:hypothetical protein DXT76_15325 [Halobacillus trueperi]